MTVGEEEVITLLATLRILGFKGQQKSVIYFNSLRSVESRNPGVTIRSYYLSEA